MIVANPRAPVGRVAACALAAAVLTAGQARADSDQPDGSGQSFWSRVTIAVPVYTHHFPNNGQFDDHNWGAFADVEITEHWSVIGGDYINSFHRNTVFAGVTFTPVTFDLGKVRVAPGVMGGVDLNGGYDHHNPVEPLLGALELNLTAQRTKSWILDRTGLSLILMPGGFNQRGAVPVSLALTYRFGP
jgi:hypothetical protein